MSKQFNLCILCSLNSKEYIEIGNRILKSQFFLNNKNKKAEIKYNQK